MLVNDSFTGFITRKPLEGCGWPLDKIEALIKSDAEVLAMWRKAVTAPVGTNQHSEGNNNISPLAMQGTSRAYTLDRLSCESPALYQSVCRGELSANKAAIEAGFRRKPTPFEQIQRLIPKLTAEERRQIAEMLNQ